MKVEYGTAFARQLKHLARRYRNIRHDIAPVIALLEGGETPGDQLTGLGRTLYKVRAPNRDAQRGKSGGYRVIYDLTSDGRCLLVTIYSKGDQGDVSADMIRRLLAEAGE